MDGMQADPFPMGPANSNRAVIGRHNEIWAVFRDQGAIWLAHTKGGTYWSSPLQVSPSGHSNVGAPMITRVGAGALAVAWQSGYDANTGFGQMHYRVVSSCGVMQAVADLGWGRDPSMTSQGSDIHFVHSTGPTLRYDEFPAYSPGLGSAATTTMVLDAPTGGSGSHYIRFPSSEIAQSRAYVGYHYVMDDMCNSIERIRAGYVDLSNDVYTGELDTNGAFLCTPIIYDLSLAADDDTGDVYIAYTIDGGGYIGHRDVVTGNWVTQSYSFDWPHLDVDADAGELLLAENVDQLLPENIEVRRGTWLGAAANPTWDSTVWTSSFNGREPEALLWRESGWGWMPWSCQLETIVENVDDAEVQLHRTCTGFAPAIPYTPDWCGPTGPSIDLSVD